MTAPARPPRPTRLNVNTADPAELLRLPGVTEALARDIIAQRPLTKLKELLLIPGLEPEHYAQIAPHLTVATRERQRREAGSARRARRKTVAPPAETPAVILEASPPVAEPAVFSEIAPPPAPVWEEVPPAPEVIIVQPRPRTLTTAPSRAPMVIAPPTAGRALFDSYAGPRIMFALFSVTLVVLVVGFSTGWINLGRPQVITVIAPTATPDVLPTQVGLAVAATLTALPSPTALPATVTPEASATPTPTLAVTVNAPLANSGMANTGEQIFYETFIPAGYWDTGENSFSKITITEGGYLDILMKLPGSIAWAMNGFSGENFYYQGTVRVDACQLGDYDGLAFRFKDEGNFLLFGLSCDGRYRLLERVEGEFHPIVDFTFTSAAIVGSNATNLLAVRADGSQISLYVNDQFVTQANVSASYAGRFGVFAKSAQTSNLLAEFDELSAWTLIR